ncbi:MAG: sensor histidine kinase [Roseburia sp.]|nr:sensor histidine kinase [Roseburia sp.]
MWEHIKNSFRNMKLAGKMVLVYLLVTGITCGISMIGLQASFHIYDTKIYDKSLQELEFFAQKVNDDLEKIENLSYTLAMDGDVQAALAEAADARYLSQEFYYKLYPIRKIFLNEINVHSSVQNAIYMDRKSVRIFIGTDCGEVEDETYQKLLAMCKEARGADVVLPPTEEFPYQLSGRDILETKNASLNYLGTVIITSDIAGTIEKQKNALEFSDSLLYVYSGDEMIYGSTQESPKLPKMDSSQGYQIIKHQGESYFMSYLKSEKNGWMYVNYVPYSHIMGQAVMLRYVMFGGLIVIFLITIVIMRKVASVITSPFQRLTETIYLAEQGDFKGARDFLQVEDRRDEAGLLAQDFKVMLEKIDSLIHENYEKQLLIKDTKYKMLQAQINPHFLYNTLNTVNWMIKGNQDASKMIVELGNLMRASFAKEQYATVAEEVSMAKSYITIQQFRYKNRAVFELQEQGNLQKYMIPRMVLQPLIENAILYGVDQSLTGCRICVSAIEKEDDICIRVADDGPGMLPEELEAVRNFTIVPKGHGIGLKNIYERLKITYKNSEFLIDSKLGEGTVVIIRIPKIVKEKSDVSVTDC